MKIYKGKGREMCINLCRVNEARLSNHMIRAIYVRKLRDCAFSCTIDPQCLLVNYVVSSSSCELNNAASADWNVRADHYIDQLDAADFINLTSHKLC